MHKSAYVIEMENVSAGYGGNAVVAGVNLCVRKGEAFGIIGLNGAGKTTLIKVLLGLRDSFGGEIVVGGVPVRPLEGSALVAYLPERFDPPSFLNGYEFVRFSMELYGRKFDAADAEGMAEKLDLSAEALKSRVNTYSKGMRQKLGIMATVLTDCPILILDEPMSGLDPKARVLVKDVLIKAKGQGRTVFLSSHILADMSEICDSVAVIHAGSVLYQGAPRAVLESMHETSLERAFLKMIERKAA